MNGKKRSRRNLLVAAGAAVLGIGGCKAAAAIGGCKAVTWVINGHPFDPHTSDATVRNGDTELWTISSNAHQPIHIHVANLQ
jgi:FtsP/CotA-like multicopper oxidase with cupredoxin domain